MGFMDKAKEAANQALAQAQAATQQGQAKVQQLRETHTLNDLYRNLGEAFYNEQRGGGSTDAVRAALAAVDGQVALIAEAKLAQEQAEAAQMQAAQPPVSPPAPPVAPPPPPVMPPPAPPTEPPPAV